MQGQCVICVCLIVIVCLMIQSATAQYKEEQYYQLTSPNPSPNQHSSDVFPLSEVQSHNHNHEHKYNQHQRNYNQNYQTSVIDDDDGQDSRHSHSVHEQPKNFRINMVSHHSHYVHEQPKNQIINMVPNHSHSVHEQPKNQIINMVSNQSHYVHEEPKNQRNNMVPGHSLSLHEEPKNSRMNMVPHHSHSVHEESNHFRINMVPFNLVPDNLRHTQGVAQDNTERHENTVSSKRTEDIMDLQTKNNVNISLIHDIFFKNFTKRGLNAQHDADTMVFPSDDVVNSTNNTTRKSKNCHYGLCEEVENYPEEKIKNIISRSKILKQYFDQIAVPAISFSNRFGEDGDPLCPTRTYSKFPKSAMNTKNIEKILVNIDEYKQGVVYETCVKDGGQCSQANGFPDGFITTCKQKYSVRRLMAVSDNMDEPVFDNFELPSCCVCMIKKG